MNISEERLREIIREELGIAIITTVRENINAMEAMWNNLADLLFPMHSITGPADGEINGSS